MSHCSIYNILSIHGWAKLITDQVELFLFNINVLQSTSPPSCRTFVQPAPRYRFEFCPIRLSNASFFKRKQKRGARQLDVNRGHRLYIAPPRRCSRADSAGPTAGRGLALLPRRRTFLRALVLDNYLAKKRSPAEAGPVGSPHEGAVRCSRAPICRAWLSDRVSDP